MPMKAVVIAGALLPGNIGPPLTATEAKFPNQADLRAQIRDPNTILPPFGKQRIPGECEIDPITEFI